MTPEAFRRWVAFYEQSPFDDFHRHHRPAALIANSMSGASTSELLDWLQPKPPDPSEAHLSEADIRTKRALGF